MGMAMGFSSSKSKQESDQTSVQGGTGEYGQTFKQGTVMGAKVFNPAPDYMELGLLAGAILLLVMVWKGKI